MRQEVGIVGYGRCGRLAAEALGERYRVTVTDVRDLSREAGADGVAWGDLAAAAGRPVVLLATPIRTMPAILDAIVPHLRRDALVLDTCSVKVRPLEWMAERLPAGVDWVGTHPLFGPDSVRQQGLAGQRIVICPRSGDGAAAGRVARAARDLGLDPVVVSAEEHDRQMARSQALVFLVARAMRHAGIGKAEYGTPTERRVASALRLVDADSDELYEDILTLNPFARETANSLEAAMREELSRLFPGS